MVAFSKKEITLLQDTDFLLTRQEINTKLVTLLSEVEREIHQQITLTSFSFPEKAFIQSGKISRGENYRGLPYFILDYPRLFSQREVFAFRTMIWWGHELSCTLHLAGESLNAYSTGLPGRIVGENNLYVSVNSTPWEFYFERDNYLPAKELTEEAIQNHMDSFQFIKLADRMPLEEQESFKPFILESLARFLKYLRPV